MKPRDLIIASVISVAWLGAWSLSDSRSTAVMDDGAQERAELVQEKYALLRAYSWSGHAAPWVEGTDMRTGATISLGDEYKGLVYVIHSQCPHCAGNLPWLNRLRDAGVPVTLVALDTVITDIEGWMDTNAVDLSLIRNPTGRLLPLIEAAGYPYSLVLWDGNLGLGALGAVREARIMELEGELTSGAGGD